MAVLSLKLLGAVFFIFLLGCSAVSFSDDFDIYPSIPIPGSKAIQTQSSSRGVKAISTAAMVVLKPLAQYLGFGVTLVIALNMARRVNEKFGSGPVQTSGSEEDKEALSVLKKDQEEIWNAILNIHNTQSASKASLEGNRQALVDVEAQLKKAESSVTSLRAQLDSVVTRLEDSEYAASKAALSSADSRDSVESSVERLEAQLGESQEALEGLKRLQEGLPDILRSQDDLVAQKLQAFKEDLKKILSKKKK
ncbi:hypothetical protein B484DRAFT_443651 [Ochromonadaceae sp. CCMP2298]|nr:hypothetical protein B484DRAFT_443651 [Ochromonadaceae sp. CCMP2298]